MFRVVPPPIIRSTYNCIYSILYLSHRYCYLLLPRQVAVTVWQIPDAVDTVVCAPDDGWKYHPKHVEQFADINKLCKVAFLLDIYWNVFTKHGPINVKHTCISYVKKILQFVFINGTGNFHSKCFEYWLVTNISLLLFLVQISSFYRAAGSNKIRVFVIVTSRYKMFDSKTNLLSYGVCKSLFLNVFHSKVNNTAIREIEVK